MGTGEQPNLAQELLSKPSGNSTAPLPAGLLPEPSPPFLLP